MTDEEFLEYWFCKFREPNSLSRGEILKLWNRAQESERRICAQICDEQASEPECPERAIYCAEAIRERRVTPCPFDEIVKPAFEYLLHFWGEVMNDNIIEKETGIKGEYLWFSTAAEREAMKKRLNEIAATHNYIIAFAEYEGELVRKRTVAKATFEYDGKEYPIEYDYGYGYPAGTAEYMFEEGNYSCDCNRSSFIHERYPDFPDREKCGDEIEMTRFEVAFEF